MFSDSFSQRPLSNYVSFPFPVVLQTLIVLYLKRQFLLTCRRNTMGQLVTEGSMQGFWPDFITFLIMYTCPLPNHCSIHMTIPLTLRMETAKCIDLRQYICAKPALNSFELLNAITYYTYIDFYKGIQESIRHLRVTRRRLGESSGMRRRVVTYLPDNTWSQHERRQPSVKESVCCITGYGLRTDMQQ